MQKLFELIYNITILFILRDQFFGLVINIKQTQKCKLTTNF